MTPYRAHTWGPSPPSKRWAGDRAGAAAVEFALVLPLVLALWLGGADFADGLSVQFKVGLAARTVADLASRSVSIDNATMAAIEGAAATVVAPYSPANLVVTVSEVKTDANGQGTVAWSDSLNGTPYVAGQALTLPAALQIPNISLLFGEVTYPYTPLSTYAFTGTINLYRNAYFFPRRSSSVTPSPLLTSPWRPSGLSADPARPRPLVAAFASASHSFEIS